MADLSNDTVIATATSASRSLANRFADVINVRDDGAAGNGTTDDRTAFVDADADAAGSTIIVPSGTYRIASNLTISSTLLMLPGAKIKPDNGVTVTLNTVPIAGAHTVFDLSAGTSADVDIASTALGEVNVLWWGPAGNGTTNDKKALQAAFDAAANKTIVFPRADTYALGSGLSISSNTRIDNAGATLKLIYSDASLSDAVACGSRLVANMLKVSVASGFAIKRVLSIGADSTVGRVEVSSVDQQANSGDKRHGGLRVVGDNVRIGAASVTNFDFGVVVTAADHCVLRSVDVSSYVRGIYVESSDLFGLHAARVLTRSPNAAPGGGAGENGLLFELCNYVSVTDVIVEDAGEHGIRVGGVGDVEGYSFSNVQVVRPGQCGLEINVRDVPSPPDPGTHLARNIQVRGLTVIDAAYATSPGSDEDGLRLESVVYATVSGVQIASSDPAVRKSASVGIYLMGCTYVAVTSTCIADVADHGIQISDLVQDPGSTGTHVAVGEIYLADVTIVGCGADGIHVDNQGQPLRDVIVSCSYIRSYGQAGGIHYGVNVDWSGSGSVTQPCVFHGWIQPASSGPVFNASGADSDVNNLIVSV